MPEVKLQFGGNEWEKGTVFNIFECLLLCWVTFFWGGLLILFFFIFIIKYSILLYLFALVRYITVLVSYFYFFYFCHTLLMFIFQAKLFVNIARKNAPVKCWGSTKSIFTSPVLIVIVSTFTDFIGLYIIFKYKNHGSCMVV